MRSWALPIVLAVVVVATGTFAAMRRLTPPAPEAVEIPQEYHEFISGLKRWPGTFHESTIKIVSQAQALGEPDVTIDITAERAEFKPAEIRVKKGQVVRLRLTGLDNGLADMPGVDELIGLEEFSGHGFQILGPYDVWITGIRKDVTKEVTFKADIAGEFEIECVVFCSPDHYLMRGLFIVEE